MAGSRLGNSAPDFTQQFNGGHVHFHEWLGDRRDVLSRKASTQSRPAFA